MKSNVFIVYIYGDFVNRRFLNILTKIDTHDGLSFLQKKYRSMENGLSLPIDT